MRFGKIEILLLSLFAFVFASCSTNSSLTENNFSDDGGAQASGFRVPASVSQTAMPSSKFPKLSRDKHSMPSYWPAQRNRIVRTTAYTQSESDHLVYGAKNAIGTQLKYTNNVRSAAADWAIYPLGTKFKVKGQPYTYVVDDYGSALVGTNTVDIYQPSKSLMKSWGRRYVEIYIVQWGSYDRSLSVLSERMGYSHIRQMVAGIYRNQNLNSRQSVAGIM